MLGRVVCFDRVGLITDAVPHRLWAEHRLAVSATLSGTKPFADNFRRRRVTKARRHRHSRKVAATDWHRPSDAKSGRQSD